jgi:hypothetical protein
MKKILNEGPQIYNFISSSGSGTVINYGSGSDFSTSYGSRSDSTSQKVTVPAVPVPVLQRCLAAPLLQQSWVHSHNIEKAELDRRQIKQCRINYIK